MGNTAQNKRAIRRGPDQNDVTSHRAGGVSAEIAAARTQPAAATRMREDQGAAKRREEHHEKASEPAATRCNLKRHHLYLWVWRVPVVRVAAELHLSGSAVHKRCVKFEIPTPGLGAWAQHDVGLTMPVPPLPRPEWDPDVGYAVSLERFAELDAQPWPPDDQASRTQEHVVESSPVGSAQRASAMRTRRMPGGAAAPSVASETRESPQRTPANSSSATYQSHELNQLERSDQSLDPTDSVPTFLRDPGIERQRQPTDLAAASSVLSIARRVREVEDDLHALALSMMGRTGGGAPGKL
jgi:hypothetical protein